MEGQNSFVFYLKDNQKGLVVLEDYVRPFDGIEYVRKEDSRISLHEYSYIDGKRVFTRTKHPFWLEWDLETRDTNEVIKILKEKLSWLSSNFFTPNILVWSGRGFHLIWQIDEFINSDEVEFLKRNEWVYKRIAKELGADTNSFYMNWYVRLPNTINTKTGSVVKWELLNDIEIRKDEYIKKVNELFELWWDGKGTERTSYELDEENIEIDVRTGLIEEIFRFCNLIRELDESWETHTYDEWFLMSIIYAVWSQYNESKKQEFIEKSQRWTGKVVRDAETQLYYTEKWLRNGIKFRSCSRLSFQYPACKGCPYASSRLSIFGIAKAVKFSYTIPLPYRHLNGEVWKDTGENIEKVFDNPIEILKIERVITPHKFMKENELKTLIRLRVKVRADMEIDKVVEFTQDNQEQLIQLLGARSWVSVKEFFRSVISANRDKIDWIYAYSGILNWKENFYRKDYLTNLYEGLECEVYGSKENFWSAIKELLKIHDIPLLFCLGASLLGAVATSDEWFMNIETLTPAFVLVGSTGVGKTLRLDIANAFWRSPRPSSRIYFPSATLKFITNKIPFIKGFIPIDELIYSGEEEKKELLYAIVSGQGRRTAMEEYEPIQGSILITGEKTQIDTFLGGLKRRYLMISIRDWDKRNNERLTQIRRILNRNYGFIFEIVPFLKENFFNYFEDYMKYKFVENIYTHNVYLVSLLAVLKCLFEYCGIEFKEGVIAHDLEEYYKGLEMEMNYDEINYIEYLLREISLTFQRNGLVELDLKSFLKNIKNKVCEDFVVQMVLADDVKALFNKRIWKITKRNIFLNAIDGHYTDEVMLQREWEQFLEAYKSYSRYLDEREKALNIFIGLCKAFSIGNERIYEKMLNLEKKLI